MKLEDVISEKWLDGKKLNNNYQNAKPYPHIVMENFIKEELLEKVANEFPNLENIHDKVVKKYNNDNEVKFASIGMELFSPAAIYLNSYLQSNLMLEYLNNLSGINETLISDPYLNGGGYHEIKSEGFLKIHADFNKHPKLNLNRRLNLLIYLNKNWQNEWGGALELFDENMNNPVKKILPQFNTAIIFTTTSTSYHGHPDPLKCPKELSRRSLAYYYFSTERTENKSLNKFHSTIFKSKINENKKIKSIIIEFTPPIIIKLLKKIFY